MRVARVDPAGRPLEGRRRQGIQAIGIVLGWLVLISVVMWATGGAHRSAAPVPWMLGICVLCWATAEHVAGRRGLVWPGSALAIVGSLSAGLGLSIITPELRLGPADMRFAVISGTAAFVMTLYLFRFRLPGLVSPVVTFSIVALFLGLYGADPERLREVEGFSPRGILAAMMRSPVWVAGFGVLSAAAVLAARRLDLKGDDFGLASARPLHLIGAGVLALVVSRGLALLPQTIDLFFLVIEWIVITVWALRINRIGATGSGSCSASASSAWPPGRGCTSNRCAAAGHWGRAGVSRSRAITGTGAIGRTPEILDLDTHDRTDPPRDRIRA